MKKTIKGKTAARKASPRADIRSAVPLPAGRTAARSSLTKQVDLKIRPAAMEGRAYIGIYMRGTDELLVGFTMDKEQLESGTNAHVVHNALREDMLGVLNGNGKSKGVGKKRVVVKRKKVGTAEDLDWRGCPCLCKELYP